MAELFTRKNSFRLSVQLPGRKAVWYLVPTTATAEQILESRLWDHLIETAIRAIKKNLQAPI